MIENRFNIANFYNLNIFNNILVHSEKEHKQVRAFQVTKRFPTIFFLNRNGLSVLKY